MEGLQIGVTTELNELAEKIKDSPEHIQNEKNRVYQFNIDWSRSTVDQRWTS
ncbi:hypothetical protein LAV79_10600 [Peribacillus butanolivorans]